VSPGASPADPAERISAAAAAEILGVDPTKVYRLMSKGRLKTFGEPHSFNRLRRGDVEEYRDRGEPISLRQAARILRRPTDFVRELIASGELFSITGSFHPVFQRDVERYAEQHPRPPVPSRPPPSGREGQIRTPAAARLLNMSNSNTRRLAAEGLIPADQDETGTYWYRPELLEMMLRSRAKTAEYDAIRAARS
jgi:hypothetical protein